MKFIQINLMQMTKHSKILNIEEAAENISYSDIGTTANVGQMTKELNDKEHPSDKYAAFRNRKERQQLTLTPSKLWYMVEAQQYPKQNGDTKVDIPSWVKNIFFPDGNPDNLRIRFKLLYKVVDGDEDDTEQEWKYVDAPNSAFPNAQSDLAGVEPYLEFTIDQYGELHAVRNESWTNLPKHYLTKDVKVHKNYLYKIEEVLVRDLKSEEVQVANMYIQPDSTDLTKKYYLSTNGSQWKVTKPSDGVGPVPAENIVDVTVITDSGNYVKVNYQNNDYYAKADKDSKTNYVVLHCHGYGNKCKYRKRIYCCL